MKNTNENAVITLTSMQRSKDGSNKTEFTSAGGYYCKGGSYYITYKEKEENGPGNSRVLLKIGGGTVTMRRMGDFQTVMTYIPGETTECIYRAPFGELPLKIKTRSVDDRLSENGGELRFCYELFAGNESTENEIYIKVDTEREML